VPATLDGPRSKSRQRQTGKAKAKAKLLAARSTAAFQGLKAFVVNLERRPDRWKRVSAMLRKETPWLKFEQFKASDGKVAPIPSDEIAETWSTGKNAHYADYFEWVHDAPGTALDGTQWKWSCDVGGEDDPDWAFEEEGEEEFTYTEHAPRVPLQGLIKRGTAKRKDTGETIKVRLEFARRYMTPGELQQMSGGERGCAHSHWRLWELAAGRAGRTLVLEDDVTFSFERSGGLGWADGTVFTERLARALTHAPDDFDVIYLGWSGWRGGHQRFQDGNSTTAWKDEPKSKRHSYLRKAEYVWTTVAYVITQEGAKKLLAAGAPMDQPVDNFMAWEASQGRLNSYVAVDEGDDDDTWNGGIVDQVDFQGDSDIQKSDGGHQGDDEKQFAVVPAGSQAASDAPAIKDNLAAVDE